MGVEMTLTELFSHPVLRELAGQMTRPAESLAPIVAVPRGGRLPLSLAQQRLWFLSQLEGASGAYHLSGRLRLVGALDCAALERALGRVVERHESLRTRFVSVEGEASQVIDPAGEGVRVEELDLRESASRERELSSYVEAESSLGFDLASEWPVRCRLVLLGEREHVLTVTLHHIVSDGWSLGIFMNELSALYGAFRAGQPDPLPAPGIQYADYASWQRQWLAGERLQRQSEYWQGALSGAPARLDVPSDRARPAQYDYAGDSVEVALGPELSRGLKSLGQRHGSTLYMTLLAGWGALLGRLAGQDEVVIGSPVAGRGRAETEGLIGFFVNTLAMRLNLAGDAGEATVSELLRRTRAQVLSAQEHGELPFEQVVEVAKPPRSLSHAPVFQVMFSWRNTPRGTLSLPGLELSNLHVPNKTAQFDLTLELGETAEGIQGAVNYATSLFDRPTVERYVGYLRRMLEAMVRDDSQPVRSLPWMGAVERERVLAEWNATEQPSPRERCVHQLFESQAECTPEAIALAFGEARVSYRELNAQANRLAHHLRRHAVKPGARVAICMDRGVEMVVSLLATLKAGGAYVPLDPTYPRSA